MCEKGRTLRYFIDYLKAEYVKQDVDLMRIEINTFPSTYSSSSFSPSFPLVAQLAPVGRTMAPSAVLTAVNSHEGCPVRESGASPR